MSESKRVAWVAPYPLRGSGGHRTIYQNINALARAGYECHVHLEVYPPPGYGEPLRDPQHGKELVEEYFGPVDATFHLGMEVEAHYPVVFATAWFTADAVRRAPDPCIRAYFVQDFEASFMPMSDAYIQAQNTLRYGFEGVTIGRWLTRRLHDEFAMHSSYFDFCADRAVYRPLDEERELAVCFVYQPEKPRRCSMIGGQALTIVKRELPEARIYFYGNDQPVQLPVEVSHLGLLPIEKCNELYNRCAVGLCFSSTNPSRIPFEMMAAGLPVVDMWGDNTRYDLPDTGTLLAEPTPESVAWAILGLLRDPARRAAMSAAGQRFMRERDLQHGFDQFVRFVDGLADQATQASAPAPIDHLYQPAAVQAPAEVSSRFRSHLLVPAEVGAPPALQPPEHHFTNGNGTHARRPSMTQRIVGRLEHTWRVFRTGA